ncbi:prolipoprotein diacylglyceryl transferase [Candidatus Nitrotoga sp. 1052]|uniref:prolipoprotein diacylglyceryl transferase n=1 Tax=Candidatus Nitrotoga sp. 1052 TaxID=2886964 RepID=UPI001EF44FB8|nr:prolipoprotein diacylglyceryl transferase [Candidatus Nitrotoga sp. 1052]CAH1087841.1 phosphatidylglycerol--prolipoprotein diacylglyceryl transferase [Candidatus Nitrotoga sp. 1052]
MLIHPQFDPVAIHLGPFAVHWYGLMYLVAFMLFLWLGKLRIRTLNRPGWDDKMMDDLLFYGILGVVLGGRLGEVLFYNPSYYVSRPLEILAVWQGGMSFHGGFLGVLVAMALFARQHKLPWLQLMDFIAPLVPLGLGAGRIGNFINAELWGRPTNVAWGMVFPNVDDVPRHPSQLYEFALEGLVLFALMWLYSRKPRPVGAVSGLFLIGYGSFRFFVEYTRNPDDGIFGLMSFGISMGQWLSLPMVIVGLVLLLRGQRKSATGHL